MSKLVLLATALAAASAAFAQGSQPPPGHQVERRASSRFDPNTIICRSQTMIGSRLRHGRICATRAQWAEQMRLERQNVEKAQTNRTWCGGVCVPGRRSMGGGGG